MDLDLEIRNTAAAIDNKFSRNYSSLRGGGGGGGCCNGIFLKLSSTSFDIQLTKLVFKM